MNDRQFREQQAHDDIDLALTKNELPPFAVSSFGKDSLVLLHLLSQHGVTNVLHLEDADEVVDWPFIWKVRDTYGLKIYPISRGRVIFFVVGDTPVFTALSFIDDRNLMVFPTSITPYSGIGSFTCVDGELHAMRGYTLNVKFDLLFAGTKHCDLTSGNCNSFMNLLSGDTLEKRKEVSFAPTIHRDFAPGIRACDPLLHWSDADVWDYIEHHQLAWSRLVYNEDHTKKPTGRQWCFRCHDPREASIVTCPRTQQKILNFAAMTQDHDLQIQRLGRLGLLNVAEVEEINAQR